jgi:hypothetical protein
MIIRPRGKGFLLVCQPDHAGLSARIAGGWRRPDRFPEAIWARFLEAVRRHDDGWILEEESPTLDPSGRPYDFKSLPTAVHVEVWRRSVDLAQAEDPYLALLIAQHGRWLYTEFQAKPGPLDQERAQGFIVEMDRAVEANAARLRAGSVEERSAVEPAALLAARRLLSFFDGLSLRLLGAIRLDRTEPLPFGREETVLTVRGEGKEVELSPWPFAAPRVELEARRLTIEAERFGSPRELAEAMARAPLERPRWTFRGGGGG